MKEERMRILKLVEEGKLSVDEALSLLENLEKASQTAEQKEAEIVNELSTAVKFEEAQKEETVHQKFQSTKEKIFEFVDMTLKKIKDFDLDLNFGHSVEISHIFFQADADFSDIDMDVANGAIQLVPWDQKDVRIECKAKVYRVENQDQARQSFLKDTIFAVEGGRLKFSTQLKWMKVEAVAYIPQIQYEKIRLRMFNGPISGGQLETNHVRMKTANGKIDFTGINAKRVEAETANGHIKIVNSLVDDLEAETINGAIKLDGDFRRVETQSFNGNLAVNLSGNRCDSLKAQATTGSIDLFIPENRIVSGEVRSSLGGYEVLLDGIQILEEKNEVIQKLLRFRSVRTEETILNLFAETKTGSVTVRKSGAVHPFK
ncbi:DUF4097 family beta strand repeat-containing protein [Neobacillus sp. SM06]|uniref:DUF4097 family beta strand repeat-containing protein n=1 Tax=Neobacillus sp. SM06 TaxID=3422492 RepID=UPI003D2B7A13